MCAAKEGGQTKITKSRIEVTNFITILLLQENCYLKTIKINMLLFVYIKLTAHEIQKNSAGIR
jgi:hypothetical protein